MTERTTESGGPRRALVTGCAGFIGSHLAARLLSLDWTVIGNDCFTGFYRRAIKEANLEELRGAARFTLVEADLAVDALDEILDGVDVVFHLAAQPGVRQSFGPDFGSYLRNNVQAFERLLAAAATHALQAVVYASSSSVYGVAETLPVREDAPLRPISPYGVTKLEGERRALEAWQRNAVPVVGLRYFTVYGPRQRPDMALAQFLSSALTGQPLSINGDGSQVREFTFVDDVVRGTVAAAEKGEPGAVYNIGGGEQWSLLDVVNCIEALLGRHLDVRYLPAAKGDPPRTAADTTLARERLGFVPMTGVADGLAAQLEATRQLRTSQRGSPTRNAPPVVVR